MTNNTAFTMKKRLFYTPDGASQGNTCTETDASFLLASPYVFTSGITITLSNGFSYFINLAGQSLSPAQMANVLNNTPAISVYGIQFSSVPGPTFIIKCYAQAIGAYVSTLFIDSTSGSPGITFGATYPITCDIPGGIVNLENSIKFIPCLAKNIWLYGTWSDVIQSTQYFMNEYWGEYVWTTDPLTPQMDPYAKQIIADLLHLHGSILLDGNTGIDLTVTAGQTLTLWVNLEVIYNNTLILRENTQEDGSRINRGISV